MPGDTATHALPTPPPRFVIAPCTQHSHAMRSDRHPHTTPAAQHSHTAPTAQHSHTAPANAGCAAIRRDDMIDGSIPSGR